MWVSGLGAAPVGFQVVEDFAGQVAGVAVVVHVGAGVVGRVDAEPGAAVFGESVGVAEFHHAARLSF